MTSSSLRAPYDRWNNPSYERRVRAQGPQQVAEGPTYLWGSAGIEVNIVFPKPPILHIRNDLFGDVVTIGTMATGGVATTIGKLQPGECVSIPLQGVVKNGVAAGLTGVFASCPSETVIACIIKE